MIGTTIGKYRIVAQIGRGGMGTVYRAIDETLDREVAIKMLHADLLSPESLQRFRTEAMTLARLHHPRIAGIHELAREGTNVLMVMEFIAGETCEKLLARTGPLPIGRAVTLCDQVLDALEHAHAAGIVHRDLKPSNVMVTPSGDVKVMDFGIARVAGTEHLTTDGNMMGTPAYMAPEQVRGEEVDQRMDLYATTVLLYRLLTRRLPFEADSPVALIHSQLTNPPTPPRQFRADLPEWIDRILLRGLAKAPSDRFQTAAEFRLALERGLAGSLGRSTGSKAVDPADEGTAGSMPIPTVIGAPTMAMPTPAPIVAPPPAIASTPMATPPPATPTPTAAARMDTTVTLRMPHLVAAGSLLGLLAAGIIVLAYVAVRRPPAQVASPETAATIETPVPAPSEAPLSAPLADSETGAQAATRPAVPEAPATPPRASAAPVRPATAPKPAIEQPPPSPAPTAPPVVPETPPVATSAAGSAGDRAPAETKTVAPESFGDIKTLVPDGTKTRELDALLSLESDHAILRSRNTGVVLQTVPYRSIAAATYARSRRPRWKEDASLAQIPKSFGGSGFFLSTSKHWLTLQSTTEFVVLRLEDKNVRTIIASIESRTGSKVDRPAGEQ